MKPAYDLKQDLDAVLRLTRPLWKKMRGKRLFITGGTGFIGTWLLESFAHANRQFNLGAKVVVLTRNPTAFAKKAPHLAKDPSISFYQGDVRKFIFPKGHFDFIIHAAAQVSALSNQKQEQATFDSIYEGTHHVLEFSRLQKKARFLLLSSGAVYGPQPISVQRLQENQKKLSSDEKNISAYAQGKRASEFLCALYHEKYGIETKVARCFAFIGPYLSLDAGFAAGDFMRDALVGRTIRVHGDGRAQRSYLYASDLTAWLWKILFDGVSCRPYNVGSEKLVSVAMLARTVSRAVKPPVSVVFGRKSQKHDRYLPSTRRATAELGLRQTVGLEQAVRQTLAWHS